MNWQLFIALRYFTRRRKERFVSIISVISVLGVIVGVSALIVVISIMTGFDIEIKEKIIGTYSHIVLLKEGGINNEEEVMNALNRNKNIIASSPFMDETAFLRHKGTVMGILLRGLDEKREGMVSNIKEYVDGGSPLGEAEGELSFGENGAIVGSELLKAIRLKKGDVITIFSPYTNEKKELTIIGTFTSGRYDYDANMVFITLKNAQSLSGKDTVSGIGMRVRDEFNVNRIKKELKSEFQYPYTVKSWMDLDKNLMRALAIEKKIMFMILGLIILVACFNIASSLIMQVLEKTKDIGILRALGARRGDIRVIFVFLGFIVGFIGVVIGGISGITIAKNINKIADYVERLTGFELFPSDIYYLSSIPVKIEPSDVAVITALSLALAALASLYPAWKASRLNPVDAIRYE